MPENDLYFRQLAVGEMANLVYLVGSLRTREALLVDPAWNVDRLLDQAAVVAPAQTGLLNAGDGSGQLGVRSIRRHNLIRGSQFNFLDNGLRHVTLDVPIKGSVVEDRHRYGVYMIGVDRLVLVSAAGCHQHAYRQPLVSVESYQGDCSLSSLRG